MEPVEIEIDAEAVQGEIVISIDSFDETTQLARDETNDGIPELSSVLAPDALGGEAGPDLDHQVRLDRPGAGATTAASDLSAMSCHAPTTSTACVSSWLGSCWRMSPG